MPEQFTIAPATKSALKARVAIDGPTGSGKIYTALRLARGMVGPEGRIGLIDTENRSAELYSDDFSFDTIQLAAPYDPRRYTGAIKAFLEAGHDAIIVDSLSHAWAGKGGLLEMVDEFKNKREHGGNKFGAWSEATPIQNEMVETILQSPAHMLVTMRSKMAYVLEQNDRGKTTPRKVGMQPIQRDDLEYEFTVILDMDLANRAEVTKTRMSSIAGRVIDKPGEDLGAEIAAWLDSGTARPETPRVRSEDGELALSQILPGGRTDWSALT